MAEKQKKKQTIKKLANYLHFLKKKHFACAAMSILLDKKNHGANYI